MTGFGRTGRWFGSDHWGLRPDILVAAKGATSGYWPFGFAAASGPVYETIAGGGFVHGFTFSHSAVGAAVAREVLRILRDEDLVAASAAKGERLRGLLRERLGDHPHVGDIRGTRADGRRRARRRPGDDGALPAGASGGWRRSWRRPASGACWSTRGRARRTASTATRSSWGRRSSRRTRSSSRIADGVAAAIEAATALPAAGSGAERRCGELLTGALAGSARSRAGGRRRRSGRGRAARSGRPGWGSPGSSRRGRPSRRRPRARRRPTPASGRPRRGSRGRRR